jgi:hypothetical protein
VKLETQLPVEANGAKSPMISILGQKSSVRDEVGAREYVRETECGLMKKQNRMRERSD